jgi:hypothetical protein
MATKAGTVLEKNYQVNFGDSGSDHPRSGASAPAANLAGFIYHDLRHPLTAILAYSPRRKRFEPVGTKGLSQGNSLSCEPDE